MNVLVRVAVNRLVMEIDNVEKTFRRGDQFEIPRERAILLENSVEILEPVSPPPENPEPKPKSPPVVLENNKPSRKR